MKNIKENNCKVSVIMTVMNGEKYLEECLNSVLKQTLKEIEILAIYGPSKDRTLEILENYQKKDDRIVIYTEERKGIGLAKNTGIEQARGEYITFLDADDYYMDEEALEKMYIAAKEHDVKVVGALRSLLISGEVLQHPLHRALLIGFENGRMFDYKAVQYDYHFHSYIYDRQMILNSDARFAEIKAYDDTHFYIRAMLEAEKFYVIPVELYCYRCHDSYDWKNEICYEVIPSLANELKFTRENNLGICHYFAMQRVNYEYGPLFEKYIREGDLKILELLLEAQKEVDNSMIEAAIKRPIDSNLIEPMNFKNGDIKYVCNVGLTNYIFTPLYNLINNGESVNYKEEYDRIYNSKTFKVGQKVVWLPKKILKLLHLRK